MPKIIVTGSAGLIGSETVKYYAGKGVRVLGIDNAVSDQWGRMSAIRPVPAIDGLLAATALTHGLILATRNDRDVAGLGATVLNPFRFAENHHRS